MIGVSFQPGANQDVGQTGPNASRPQTNGVQEAIKVLSLRLPKVVGAQAVSSMPLLTSQGSGGNPRVDSIVQQVMSRIGGGQPGANMPAMPSMPTQMSARDNGPTFSNTPRQAPPAPWQMPHGGLNPRITVDNPLGYGDFTVGQDGRPMSGAPPAAIAELPANFQIPQAPPPPSSWPDLSSLYRQNQPDVSDPIPFEQPLF